MVRRLLWIRIGLGIVPVAGGLVLVVLGLTGQIWSDAIAGGVVALAALPSLLRRVWILRRTDLAKLDGRITPETKTVSPFRFVHKG